MVFDVISVVYFTQTNYLNWHFLEVNRGELYFVLALSKLQGKHICESTERPVRYDVTFYICCQNSCALIG